MLTGCNSHQAPPHKVEAQPLLLQQNDKFEACHLPTQESENLTILGEAEPLPINNQSEVYIGKPTYLSHQKIGFLELTSFKQKVSIDLLSTHKEMLAIQLFELNKLIFSTTASPNLNIAPYNKGGVSFDYDAEQILQRALALKNNHLKKDALSIHSYDKYQDATLNQTLSLLRAKISAFSLEHLGAEMDHAMRLPPSIANNLQTYRKPQTPEFDVIASKKVQHHLKNTNK
jgi:hypothetical protein